MVADILGIKSKPTDVILWAIAKETVEYKDYIIFSSSNIKGVRVSYGFLGYVWVNKSVLNYVI